MVVVSILSGKGGVGKTTVTSNIAAALSSVFDRKVIILDTNLAGSHIRLHYGMYDQAAKTLSDVMKGATDISTATYRNELTGVDIASPSAGLNKGVDLEKLKKLAVDLAQSAYDFVVIDASPGFGDDVMNAIKAADKVLIVTNPSIPAVNDALKIVEVVKSWKKKFAVVLNMVKDREYELHKDNVENMLDAKVDAIIPEDEKVPEAISYGVPVVVFSKGSDAAIEFKKLAASLINQEYRPSMWERIKWAFGA